MSLISDIPATFKLVYSEESIREGIAIIAKPISEWAKECRGRGSELVVIPVLRGGLFFGADLARALTESVELAPARTFGYSGNLQARRDVVVEANHVPVSGRHLLIVDDICDSGRSLSVLSEELKERGAASVRAAVLIRRQVPKPEFEPHYVCFNYPGAEWFVGYGMDDQNRFRNASSVYVLPAA